MSVINDALLVKGELTVTGSLNMATASVTNANIKADAVIARSKLAQDTSQPYVVPLTTLRVHDAITSFLPSAATSDDLGLITGTFGTDAPTVQSSDGKATTVTQYGRFLFQMPPEYDDNETVVLRVRAGMITTISDGTATVDVQCYEADGDGAVGADLCTTAATTMNSLTKANVDFTITDASLVAGDWLDVRVTIAITDAATGTAVIGEISQILFMLDIRG